MTPLYTQWVRQIKHGNTITVFAQFISHAVMLPGTSWNPKINSRLWLKLKTRLYQDILRHSLSVQHPYDPVAVTCIVLGVSYHYDSGSLFVHIGKQFHHLVAIA